MRKIILFALAAMMLVGCKKDPVVENHELNPLEPNDPNNPLSYLSKEYNINKPGLVLESFGVAPDTNYIFFGGRINKKLWVGYYDKQTKQSLLDWTDSNVLDTIVPLDVGYGEIVTHKLDGFRIFRICNNGDAFSFILLGDDNSLLERAVVSNLYFIKNGQLIIHKENKYSLRGLYVYLVPWFEGFMTATETKQPPWQPNYIMCYNISGEKLFETNNFNVFNPNQVFSKNMTPINYEEGILFSNTSGFIRANIKNNSTIWTNPNQILSNLPSDTKIGDTVIDKLTKDTWKYSVPYTLYDGRKFTADIELNINSGYFDPPKNLQGLSVKKIYFEYPSSKALFPSPSSHYELTAYVDPPNAENTNILYESSDNSIIEVISNDENNCRLVVHKAGTATITATSVDGNHKDTHVVTTTGEIEEFTNLLLSVGTEGNSVTGFYSVAYARFWISQYSTNIVNLKEIRIYPTTFDGNTVFIYPYTTIEYLGDRDEYRTPKIITAQGLQTYPAIGWKVEAAFTWNNKEYHISYIN